MATNEKMSLDFIQGAGLNTDLINQALNEVTAADVDRRAEESEARKQATAAAQQAATVNSNADILAGSLIKSTESQKDYLAARADYEKKEIDTTADNAVINSNLEQQSILESLQAANLTKLEEINLREAGYKLDENGNKVKMSTGEKIINFITKDLVYSPTQRKEMILDENAKLDAEILNTQAQISNALAHQTAGIGLSPEMRTARKLVVDAEAFANMDKVDTAGKQSLYTLAAESYNMSKDQLNSIINIANIYNESDKAGQIIQLASLKLQSDQIRLAYGEANDQQEILKTWESYVGSAYEIGGYDMTDKKNKDLIKLTAHAIANQDWQTLTGVLKTEPGALSVLNSINPQDVLSEVILAADIDVARTISAGDDPEAKLIADTKLSYFNSEFSKIQEASPDSPTGRTVATILEAKGVYQGDDNYAAERESVMKMLAGNNANQLMAEKMNNSIDTTRRTNQLKPVTEAATSHYFQQRTRQDPSFNVSTNIVKSATALSKSLDKNMSQFTSDPAKFVTNFINEFESLDYSSTPKQIQEYSRGMAYTFKAMKDANDLQNQEDPLYKISADWTLTTDAKIQGFNLRGRDLTDENTWNFLLSSIAKKEPIAEQVTKTTPVPQGL